MEQDKLVGKDTEFYRINQLYDECLNYLKSVNGNVKNFKEKVDFINSVQDINEDSEDPDYDRVELSNGFNKDTTETKHQITDHKSDFVETKNDIFETAKQTIESSKEKCKQTPRIGFKVENELKSNESINIIDYDTVEVLNESHKDLTETKYKIIDHKNKIVETKNAICETAKQTTKPNNEKYDKLSKIGFKDENELKSNESINVVPTETKSERLRRLSHQLPKIIITQSNTSLNNDERHARLDGYYEMPKPPKRKPSVININYRKAPTLRNRTAYGDFPKRLVSKSGMENVALISNVPFERIRLLNDTFHTLINLRWRWIVSGTVVVHFAIWLVFAVFWYVAALAHYDFEPNPPERTCVTGGTDFVTIFLASVEAQTTIGFGDRAIDEECPESIFLFIMQLILGTGLSGVLTCVVYAKLTRPEKLSRDGVGFSKKAVISMRDGQLCLMVRAWDLNYDHIISSEFSAHFINTYRSKEGEVLRYYARSLPLQQRQFLLWPVTLVHVIDAASPLYRFSPDLIANNNYEITVSLKGASASMGTFTQSQTSYMPREIVWGHRFPPVVKFDRRKQKYAIDHKKLDVTEPVDTPFCSASELISSSEGSEEPMQCPGTPSSFSDQISGFVVERTSSFRKKDVKV